MSDGIEIRVLGSGSGLPGRRRDTTSLLVGCGGEWTLVDCPGGVIHKLAVHGLVAEDLSRLVLTHNHVDHVYGVPHLLHALAIAGERDELAVLAPGQTLDTVRGMVELHGLRGERYPDLELRPIPLEEGVELVAEPAWSLRSSPTAHGRDTVALRFSADGVAFCHSSDTRECDAVAALARDSQLLLHDCGGPHRLRDRFDGNHSSALQAARVAGAAGVERLVLIHIGPEAEEFIDEVLREASGAFEGGVVVAADGDLYRLPEPRA